MSVVVMATAGFSPPSRSKPRTGAAVFAVCISWFTIAQFVGLRREKGKEDAHEDAAVPLKLWQLSFTFGFVGKTLGTPLFCERVYFISILSEVFIHPPRRPCAAGSGEKYEVRVLIWQPSREGQRRGRPQG